MESIMAIPTHGHREVVVRPHSHARACPVMGIAPSLGTALIARLALEPVDVVGVLASHLVQPSPAASSLYEADVSRADSVVFRDLKICARVSPDGEDLLFVQLALASPLPTIMCPISQPVRLVPLRSLPAQVPWVDTSASMARSVRGVEVFAFPLRGPLQNDPVSDVPFLSTTKRPISLV